MKHPDQEQHRISQVYLRQWAFKDHLNADCVCVLEKGNPIIHAERIKRFTAETNLFDTTAHDEGFERYFDEKCKIVETNFNKIMEALDSCGYTGQERIYLTEFASNLFVRQSRTYEFIASILEKQHLRDKLLNEISILEEDGEAPIVKGMYEEIAIDSSLDLDGRVSSAILQAWKHFNKVLSRFNHVILKAPLTHAWVTLDNPVIVKNFGHDGWLIGPDAEIYFPLSKRYLVYMFLNTKSSKDDLHSLQLDVINDISFEVFDEIVKNVICKEDSDYFIFDESLCNYNLETDQAEENYRYNRKSKKERKNTSLMDTLNGPWVDDEHFRDFLKMINPEEEALIVTVDTHADAKVNECIAIVDRMVNEVGGKRILGWQLRIGPYLMEAEFHAIWETPNGELKDIAFKSEKIPAILFVKDERIQYEGKQINNIRFNPYKIPLLDDFIEVSNHEFRLLNKDDRALLYGDALNEALTPQQRWNIHVVSTLKSNLLNFLNSGGNVDHPCPCKSGKLYKHCHREFIKMLSKLD